MEEGDETLQESSEDYLGILHRMGPDRTLTVQYKFESLVPDSVELLILIDHG